MFMYVVTEFYCVADKPQLVSVKCLPSLESAEKRIVDSKAASGPNATMQYAITKWQQVAD